MGFCWGFCCDVEIWPIENMAYTRHVCLRYCRLSEKRYRFHGGGGECSVFVVRSRCRIAAVA